LFPWPAWAVATLRDALKRNAALLSSQVFDTAALSHPGRRVEAA
jgi:hypothetical protein